MKHNKFVLFVFILSLYFSLSCITEKHPVGSGYTKKEVYITMRDGKKLFTSIYSPADLSQKYPIMLIRTPYSIAPYGEANQPPTLGPSVYMMKEKYIFVYQDVRGRFMSEGEYVNMRPYIPVKKSNKDIDETTDTYDSIEWLIHNVKNNNGNVGMWGLSYPGFYAAIGCIDAHPALKAVNPQAPISDWFIGDDFHHNGAFFLSDFFHFFGSFGRYRNSLTKEWPQSLRPKTVEGNDGYKFYQGLEPLSKINELYYNNEITFWNEVIKHPDYDDFWKSRSTLPHLKNIKPAVMITGGWFDAEDLFGIMHTYQQMESNTNENKVTCTLGPWSHGGWYVSDRTAMGDMQLGSRTGDYYQKNIELPFFNYYLKGKGKAPNTEANIFVTGSNEWKNLPQWPPANVTEKKIYFAPDKTLSFTQPSIKDNAFYTYISDPANPVPYTAVKEYSTSRTFMVEDQRFASARNDVLTCSSAALDNNITIAGPITAELFVSTSGTDADWVVKVIDAYPDNISGKMKNYQMLIRWEIMRGKYRNSYERPEPFIPGQPTKVIIKLNDICHTFLKGHKIIVQIQSSFFPMADINPQTFTNIYTCDKSAFIKAEQKVYYSKKHPSFLKVNIMAP